MVLTLRIKMVAKRFYIFSSSLLNASVVLFLTLLPLCMPQTAEQSDRDSISGQEISGQSVKVHEDFVELLQSPLYASQHFTVRFEYRCKTARLVSLEVLSYDHESTELTEFRHNFAVPLQTETTQVRNVRVHLRDSLVFRDNRAINLVTDMHTSRLKIVVSVLSLEALSLDREADVFAWTEREIFLIPPWRRPVKPGLCITCFVEYLEKAEDLRIPMCQRVRDVVTFVDFPVALTGKEEGFKKKLYPIDWNDSHLNKIQKTAKPRFTITTWIYVLEPCTRELCSVIQHRSKGFLTPLVSLIQEGKFHIQLHFKDGSAQAFLTRGNIRRNSWNQVILTFNDTVVTVTIRYGQNLENEEEFIHHDFPKGSYDIDDSEGFWVIGGTNGFASFNGFLGPTTLYRRRALSASEVPLLPSDHQVFSLDLENYYSRCASVVNGLTMKMEELAIDKRQSLQDIENESCQAKYASYYDLYENHESGDPHICDVTFSGETPEADRVVADILRNDSLSIRTVGQQIFDIASKLLRQNINNSPLALNLLRISSCTSHTKALYTTGIMYVTGLGVQQDFDKAWQFLLIGAVHDHPLSQMSLGYRTLIGGDGFQKHCDIAAGYYKMAALTSDNVIQKHQLVHTHSEAVRLDDYEEVASHKGKESDIFQWVAHQALQGIGDAQGLLGDMYWWGKKGFDRDLNEALKFYKMNAELGKPEGLFNLGISKLKGEGTEKNETEAFELIGKAAAQDYPPALNALGFIEINFRSNYSGAVIYFKRAAEKGDRDGLNNLGIAIDGGWVDGGVAPDKAKAIEYWKKAAGKGHPGACLATGEELRTGYYVEQDCATAIVFLRFVAEQHPEVGWLLRGGLQSYNKHQLYQSLVSYILAGETGMEVPQYNAALLCDENEKELQSITAVNCAMRYFNNSAQLGWVFSMMKVGDSFWYGKHVPHDMKIAGRMYSEAASKNDHPHAVYNLAYMVEYNYSLAGINWNNVDKTSIQKGNLTFAAVLYQRCRDSKENNNESYLPCAFGLVRVIIKDFYRNHTIETQVMATLSTVLALLFSFGIVKVGNRME